MSDGVVYGVIGFFTGAVIGGYFVGRMCGKQHRKAIDELRHQYEYDELEDDWKDPFEEKDDKKDIDAVKLSETVKKEMTDSPEPDYATLSRKYRSDHFDKEMTRYAHPGENDKDPDDIHIIDSESFQRDISRRDNETLTYYQEDGVLADSNNKVIENEETVIGVEAMEKIFDCGDDYVYVSDENDDKMYEIVVEHNQSFYRDVLGV